MTTIYDIFKNDISMNNSVNIIVTEFSNMYKGGANKKIVEPFMLQPIEDNIIKEFNEGVQNAKTHGYEINFTIEELYNVLSLLELKAKLLTSVQRLKRKKIFTCIKDELIKFKESGKINGFISQLPLSNVEKTNVYTNTNILALFTLLQNIVDLYLDDINNIDNQNNIKIIIITTIIVFILLGIVFFYLFKNNKLFFINN